MSRHDSPSGSVANGGSLDRRDPTDQELMLWADGELDPRRAAEVEALVLSNPRARAIIAGLRQGSEVLTFDALGRAQESGADSIVDGVMAALDKETARVAPVRHLRPWRTALAASVVAAAAAAAVVVFLPRAGRVAAVPGESAIEPAFSGAVIDVVDFGARPGTIFYVPSEDESATAVVWLTEDDASPSSGETL
jgi:anti-sigma factor RsiW